MTYLNELKSGDSARIIEIDKISDPVDCSALFKSLEGGYIRIVSCFGNVLFTFDGKKFGISKGFAERIRIIKLD